MGAPTRAGARAARRRPGAAALSVVAALGCAAGAPSGEAPAGEQPAWVAAAQELGRTEGDHYLHDGLGLA